jgi:predicted permease
MKRAEQIYAALLYLLPPSLRRSHGTEMRQWARTALRQRGVRAFPLLAIDLAAACVREWFQLLKGSAMTGLMKDLAYAVRLLLRSPGFSAAAVVTLALGIGANAAIFSLADATLLRPLRVTSPSDLYAVNFASSYPDYVAYTALSQPFSGVAGFSSFRVNAAAEGRADLVPAACVSGNYFGVLGLRPAAGRLIGASDDDRNGPAVAVLTYRWWQTRFGGDPSIVGKTIRLNNAPVLVIGIASSGFAGTSLLEPVNLFIPLTHAPRVRTGFFAGPAMLTDRGRSWVRVVGRLRPGVSPAVAAAKMEATYRVYHPVNGGATEDPLQLAPLRAGAFGGENNAAVSRFVALLMTVVGLTLLLGCANLANLLLSRAAARRREIGVRMAIGAGRARVAWQLVVESLVLAGVGGATGLGVAAAGLRILGAFQLPGGTEIAGLGLRVNGRIAACTAGIALLSGLLFGLAPAWGAARTDLLSTLRDDSRTQTGRGVLRGLLVGAQVAISLVLLAGTGLFLRSLTAALDVRLGFNPSGVAAVSTNLGAARYDAARASVYYREALDRARRLPGVRAAAWTTVVPTLGLRSMSVSIEGYRPAPDEDVHVYSTAVTSQYFEAAGTRILRGRPFLDSDSATAPLVAIINEAAARRYFRGRDPLQGRLKFDDEHWVQIVGVAEDTTIHDLDDPPEPFVYSPFAQDPFGDQLGVAHLLVRTKGDPSALLAPLVAQLRGIDRNAPVSDAGTLEWRLRRLVMPQRMGATLFGAFAIVALVLATVGIYGVASYAARVRTREIGIRIALGAERAQIRRLMVRRALSPIVGGILLGGALAFWLAPLAATFIYGVSPRDPLTLSVVAALLGGVALIATWVPARRAARLEPVAALRTE